MIKEYFLLSCLLTCFKLNMASFSNVAPIEVGYWSIRGLGAPLRMMVMYANHPLLITNYDAFPKQGGGFDVSEWTSVKPKLKEENPLINLPFIRDGEIIVSQSNACFLYLGRKLKMLGSNEAELCECEQLLCEIMDIRNSMIQFCYGPLSEKEAASQLIHKNNLNFAKLELWLQKQIKLGKCDGHSKLFLVGNSATAPDFHLYEMLVQFQSLCTFYGLPSFWEHLPTLHKFYELFVILPQNQKYFNSKLVKIPFNNKMATFGGTITNGKWDHSATAPTYDRSAFDISGNY